MKSLETIKKYSFAIITAIFLVVVLCFNLFGCGAEAKSEANSQSTSEVSSDNTMEAENTQTNQSEINIDMGSAPKEVQSPKAWHENRFLVANIVLYGWYILLCLSWKNKLGFFGVSN